MKKPVIVTMPHQHTKAEAIKRIREGLEEIKPQLAPYISALEEEWRGDYRHFNVVAIPAGDRAAGDDRCSACCYRQYALRRRPGKSGA